MVVLAYDLGTTLLKTTLMDTDGQILASKSAAYKTYSDGACMEQSAEDWWSAICRTTNQLASDYPDYAADIGAIGVSGHMSGCLPVDANGDPLMRAMLHADTRAVEQKKAIEQTFDKDELYRKTGCILDTRTTLCKILWLHDQYPQIYSHTSFFIQSKDFIVSRLTGKVGVTDYSDASHAMLLDVNRREYMDAEVQELGLSREKFPTLFRGIDVVGTVTSDAAAALGIKSGIPVICGGGDGACANAGAGISSPGQIYCSLGTTGWIAGIADQPIHDEKRRVFDIMSLDGVGHSIFGTMQTAGRSVEWAKDLFGLDSYQKMDQLAAQAPAGCHDLVFLPYLQGERSPIYDSNARGLFFCVDNNSTQSDFLRAVEEGVSYGLRSILDVFRERQAVQRMRIIGGGASSVFWLQIIADVCDIELETLNTNASNVTSMGVAFAACVGTGVYDSLDEAAKTLRRGRIIYPSAAPREVYTKQYHKYLALYPHVKDLYEDRR